MTFSAASGELRSSTINSRQRSNSRASQRSRDEFFVGEALGHDHVRHRVEQRDVGAGHQLQKIVGLDMRHPHQFDRARVGDDQPGALRAGAAS